ncbi:hypothetical protein COU56_00460 [Candidatus Pacearchaeota archaeon CG10_big_fil_rev_8_21_14_0_10_31_9]|nr:MAG: hypothetical protein AUJ62_00030 [Candidatus Pacearchaeota archaeon CG1_02_32_21]PIN96053.1 MAG: hypothetical protein COU56_00460 [Candidatus Pacearchaeota archaeon CG10_big_fil_rev_8_21_14_0_10_31_9]PIZ82805.1 MAG: hypothetical protein COX97_02810 [Candidatus Pacearchaeota archaeon CG_4_10_14_0_2_um_filter_05_32_18]
MRKESLFLLIGIILISIISMVFLISALSDKEILQNELNILEQDLSAKGYDWLSNFMIILLYLNINYVYNWGLKSIK